MKLDVAIVFVGKLRYRNVGLVTFGGKILFVLLLRQIKHDFHVQCFQVLRDVEAARYSASTSGIVGA
ncbi:hypothetical protein WJ17_18880 [Burkholderia vietnamiensis]|nr:hypothetical protein WJ17_18880 [Burkholderia vietnamiensis]